MIIEKSIISLSSTNEVDEITLSFKEYDEITIPGWEFHDTVNVNGFPAFINLKSKDDFDNNLYLDIDFSVNIVSLTLLSDIDDKLLNDIDNKTLDEIDIKQDVIVSNKVQKGVCS